MPIRLHFRLGSTNTMWLISYTLNMAMAMKSHTGYPIMYQQSTDHIQTPNQRMNIGKDQSSTSNIRTTLCISLLLRLKSNLGRTYTHSKQTQLRRYQPTHTPTLMHSWLFPNQEKSYLSLMLQTQMQLQTQTQIPSLINPIKTPS